MIEDKKIKTIIIEDDKKSQDYLKDLIQSHFEALTIVGTSENIADSVRLIESQQPELIFMDIELTDGLSFEIFNRLNFHDFEVIFVTAYDNFIQQAIDHYAFSFIVKPIEPSKLVASIAHYLKLKERLYSQSRIELLQAFLQPKQSKILLQVGHEYVSVELDDVIKCDAEGNYTTFHLTDKKSLLVSKPLKHFERLLIDKGFFKPHRSAIINVSHIKSIYKKETIILDNNDKVHVSVRNKSKLTELINSMS